jgi:nitrite reductase/ring-hydroxylating ferredoxin subunit
MTEKIIQRRDFLKLTGVVGGAFLLTSCSKISDLVTEVTLGATQTSLPQIEGAWSYSEGTLKLDLTKLPEISDLGSAVRIEGDVLPDPILVVLGEDGNYYAFKNVCAHAGRMIDPVAGTMTLTCTSIVCKDLSKYDYQGNVLSGLAQGPLTSNSLSVEDDQLIITV